MGIYIKSMRMPENCIKCPMQFGGMCYVMPAEVDESRVAPTVEAAWEQGKPDWCPLVEIPAHGRLIDADALLKKTINNPLHAPYIVEKDIRDMLTVIEGSENYEHTD